MAIEYGQSGWNEDMIPKVDSVPKSKLEPVSDLELVSDLGKTKKLELVSDLGKTKKSDLSNYGQGLNAIGGILQAYGIWQSGNDAYASKELQALQYESHINTVKAVSQKTAEETRRQTGLVQSRIITLAAASGAGASDPGVVNLIARQQGYGAYQAALDLYKGEDEARLLKMKAQTARWEGQQAKKYARIGAVSSLMQTAAMAAFMA